MAKVNKRQSAGAHTVARLYLSALKVECPDCEGVRLKSSKWPLRNNLLYVRHLPDVSLPDENARMMDGLGEAQFEHLGLQPALQEILDFQTQHVVEFHAVLVQHADPYQTTQQGIT